MGLFHVFKIVQMVLNRAKSLKRLPWYLRGKKGPFWALFHFVAVLKYMFKLWYSWFFLFFLSFFFLGGGGGGGWSSEEGVGVRGNLVLDFSGRNHFN